MGTLSEKRTLEHSSAQEVAQVKESVTCFKALSATLQTSGNTAVNNCRRRISFDNLSGKVG